jgi:uncharacterized tellurite resistance protein B-like protein
MLDAIRNFFDRHAGGAGGARERHTIELATAALLVEVMRVDNEVTDAEREALLGAVRDKLGLTGDEAARLVALAEEELRRASDYFQFTSLVNERFSYEQKLRVIELMWQVAYADATLSAHELHLMRRIAGLLHIPDSAYIAAKLRAKQAAGQQ